MLNGNQNVQKKKLLKYILWKLLFALNNKIVCMLPPSFIFFSYEERILKKHKEIWSLCYKLFYYASIGLQGMVFDLEKGSTLHIDLAKSNSRSKRPRIGILLIMLFSSISLQYIIFISVSLWHTYLVNCTTRWWKTWIWQEVKRVFCIFKGPIWFWWETTLLIAKKYALRGHTRSNLHNMK